MLTRTAAVASDPRQQRGGRAGQPIWLCRLALALSLALSAAMPAAAAQQTEYLNIWVHYDYMVADDHSDAPSKAAMDMVVAAFKQHGVTLHIDPQHSAIPAHRVIVPDWPGQYGGVSGIYDPSCTGPDAVRFSDLKAEYMPGSNHPWHYAVFGDYVFGDPALGPDGDPYIGHCPATQENGGRPPQPGMTGVSQVGFLDVDGGLGYSFVVAVQSFRDVGLEPMDYEAALFMHELGHNLGLCHGGPNLDGCGDSGSGSNFKPNYLSVMNYLFQWAGIPYAATPGSTTISGDRVDYSDVKLPDLNETNLDENVGIQDAAHPTDITFFKRGTFHLASASGPVDWNQDGDRVDTGLQGDLNGDLLKNTLHGADDWAWIHSRLTPPAITSLSPVSIGTGGRLQINGVNLMGPAIVTFTGGVSALAFNYHRDLSSPNTSFLVYVPLGARSGPVTVLTPEVKATSDTLTIVSSSLSDPTGIAAGPDGNLWFTDSRRNGIGRITPLGTVTEFQIPEPSSNPWAIAAGPDGNLWFTEQAGNRIGRITPSGVMTEFALPRTPGAATAGPEGITAGEDGNLWFTEFDAVKIGRITTSGVITEYPLQGNLYASAGVPGVSAGSPRGIAASRRDGNVWFTEGFVADTRKSGIVGRITPSGTITQFELYAPYCCPDNYVSHPAGIAQDSFGDLWYADPWTDNLLTQLDPELPAAYRREHFTFIAGSLGEGIALSPDDNIWFTVIEPFDQIGFMDFLSYETRTFQLLQPAWGITAGPDGNMWATVPQLHLITKVTSGGTITEFPIP